MAFKYCNKMNKVVAFKKTLDFFLNDHGHFFFSPRKEKIQIEFMTSKMGCQVYYPDLIFYGLNQVDLGMTRICFDEKI